MASAALPLILLGGAAFYLFSRSGDEPDGDEPDGGVPDGNGGNSAPSNGGGGLPPSKPYEGSEGGQNGDIRWDINELDSGQWQWRAWRWTPGFSQSGWSQLGFVSTRSNALLLAKRAAAELAQLDGAAVKEVEDRLVSVQNYPSPTGSPYNSYPPLKRVFMDRDIGPNVSYGINIYEDAITRQDGRYIAYLVIPEKGSQTIRRSKSRSQLSSGAARIDDIYDLLMTVVDQYW